MSAPSVVRGDGYVRVEDKEGGVFGGAAKLKCNSGLYTHIRFSDCDSMEIFIAKGDLEIYTDLDRLSDLHAMLGVLIKEATILKGD